MRCPFKRPLALAKKEAQQHSLGTSQSISYEHILSIPLPHVLRDGGSSCLLLSLESIC